MAIERIVRRAFSGLAVVLIVVVAYYQAQGVIQWLTALPPRAIPEPKRPPSPLGNMRVVPEQRDGKVIGLRLFGIRPGSLPSVLGMQNGDRLESINGLSVATPAQAREAYAELRHASQLRVHLVRMGSPLELLLNIN